MNKYSWDLQVFGFLVIVVIRTLSTSHDDVEVEASNNGRDHAPNRFDLRRHKDNTQGSHHQCPLLLIYNRVHCNCWPSSLQRDRLLFGRYGSGRLWNAHNNRCPGQEWMMQQKNEPPCDFAVVKILIPLRIRWWRLVVVRSDSTLLDLDHDPCALQSPKPQPLERRKGRKIPSGLSTNYVVLCSFSWTLFTPWWVCSIPNLLLPLFPSKMSHERSFTSWSRAHPTAIG